MNKKSHSPKERLMAAAIRLFAEKGYAGASVDEIVAETGLAKPALYYYFKNKEELYTAILSYGFDQRLKIMKEAFEKHRDWKNQLTAFVNAVLEFSKKKRDLCRVTFQASFAPVGETPSCLPMQKMAVRNMEYMTEFFQRGIQEKFFKKNVHPRTLALAFHGQILMYILLLSLNSPNLPKKVSAEEIVDLFLQGAEN